jgi:hypothetical protein
VAQIGPYRFDADLILNVGFRSDGHREEGEVSPVWIMVPARSGSELDESGDAGLHGGDGGDDEVRQSTASPMVVVAACLACRWAARVRLEAVGAAGARARIASIWGVIHCRVLRRS